MLKSTFKYLIPMFSIPIQNMSEEMNNLLQKPFTLYQNILTFRCKLNMFYTILKGSAAAADGFESAVAVFFLDNFELLVSQQYTADHHPYTQYRSRNV